MSLIDALKDHVAQARDLGQVSASVLRMGMQQDPGDPAGNGQPGVNGAASPDVLRLIDTQQMALLTLVSSQLLWIQQFLVEAAGGSPLKNGAPDSDSP
ncbi:MAG TPA: hypothetical protein VEQ85_06010 [Lacipirellulaceae bacterium]|nr:hypothetical protein [Lacipirellulaceae bacterium]